MCDKIKFKLNNIKGHFSTVKIRKLKTKLKEFSLDTNMNVKLYHNFCVLRDKFVYIIWFNSGFVNVTKITSPDMMETSILHFCKVFSIRSKHVSSFIIDNLTASGKLQCKINLRQLSSLKVDKTLMGIDYNVAKFPGAFIHVYNEGTFTIFGSGSYNIIGCKCEQSMVNVCLCAAQIIEQLQQYGCSNATS